MTRFLVDGPAAGHDLLKTVDDPSRHASCSAPSTTAPVAPRRGAPCCPARRTSTSTSSPRRRRRRPATASRRPSRRTPPWWTVEPRFDARTAGYENEVNRFGWIVEIDPMDPDSTPVKHTALGRFKHEAATIRIAPSGHVVAYSGDDERFDYVYKFVSRRTYDDSGTPAARAPQHDAAGRRRPLRRPVHRRLPRSEITGTGALPADGAFDGSGAWLPLVQDGASQGARHERRRGAGLHPARRRRRRRDEDGPPRGRRAQPARPGTSTSP